MSSVRLPSAETTSQSTHLRVAIVTPRYKSSLSRDEEQSLHHLTHFLGQYDQYLIMPESLSISHAWFAVKRFKDDYFTSVDAYSRLMLSREFYAAFEDYDYLLIYQLDAIVFFDRLIDACYMGYDYIGAPWLKARGHVSGFSRVGNGGLSLRRVASFLRVLESTRFPQQGLWSDLFRMRLPDLQDWKTTDRFRKMLAVVREVHRGVRWYTAHYTLNEDRFWSDRAHLFDPGFHVAPVEIGLQFAFEREPRYCFEQNKRKLPFGCHAWMKWDRKFWEPYLLHR
jgi:hypothetical protein